MVHCAVKEIKLKKRRAHEQTEVGSQQSALNWIGLNVLSLLEDRYRGNEMASYFYIQPSVHKQSPIFIFYL